MNLEEIKAAVQAGKRVCWKAGNYVVTKDLLILCTNNGNCIGLTWQDGVTLNGQERDFYVDETVLTVLEYPGSRGYLTY